MQSFPDGKPALHTSTQTYTHTRISLQKQTAVFVSIFIACTNIILNYLESLWQSGVKDILPSTCITLFSDSIIFVVDCVTLFMGRIFPLPGYITLLMVCINCFVHSPDGEKER